jgi:hypothetical protein
MLTDMMYYITDGPVVYAKLHQEVCVHVISNTANY